MTSRQENRRGSSKKGQDKHWVFTLHNYTDDDVERMNNLINTESGIRYIIYGKENGEEGETPHLQGFISFVKKRRFSAVKEILGRSSVHVERAKYEDYAAEYCKKEGDYFEFGIPPPKQGQRTDLDALLYDIKNGETNLKILREKHIQTVAQYPKMTEDLVRDWQRLPKVKEHPLRRWQIYLNELLEKDPHDREIYFVVDPKGNSGKSWFADWFQEKKGADLCQVLTPHCRDNMALALNTGNTRYLFIDAPRSRNHSIDYGFLEDVKNGRVFSTKYQSFMKRYQKMHIVVMMNESPDMNALTTDRYVIINTDSVP
jgi:hypothetical protein